MSKTREIKVFYISLPFDRENSGDYDYCQVSVRSLRDLGVNACYVTNKVIEEKLDQQLAYRYRELTTRVLELMEGFTDFKNKGGVNFYSTLNAFYPSQDRKDLFNFIKQHLLDARGSDVGILNLQLRSPETGFLFAPEDLEDLKLSGFKVTVTCHEYKLNYDRRWL